MLSLSTGSAAGGPWELLFNRFIQFHAATAVGHVFKLMRRITTLDSLLTYNDQYEFTPGFFLPGIFNFLVNYVLWTVVALALVWKPDSSRLRRIWLLLLTLHFLAIPLRVPNHYVVVWLGGVVIFLVDVWVRDFSSGPFSKLSSWIPRQTTTEEIYQTGVSAIKILFSLTYGWAALHKVNYAYFDPAETPVRRIFRPVFLSVGWTNYPTESWAYIPLAIGSIWIEGSLALLPFMNPQQRRWLLIQGLFFHCWTVLAGAPDYSVIIVSFYVLFTHDPIEPMLKNWRVVLGCLPISLIFFRCSFLFSPGYRPPKHSLFWHLAEPVEYIGVLLFFWSWLVLLYLRRTAPSSSSKFALPFSNSPSKLNTYQQLTDLQGFNVPPLKWARTFLLIFFAVYTINCLGPYLGMKFEWSQAMYSQLKYDGSNHLFIPTLNTREQIYYYNITIQPARNVSAEEMKNKRGLADLMAGGIQQKHFFWAGVRALCRRPELRPIKTSVTIDHEKNHWDDICDHLSWPQWFGLYPPKAKFPLLGL